MNIERFEGKARRSIELAIADINIWEGSVRSGKTIASLWAWLKFVREGPAGNLVMIGKTERTLKRNIIDPLIEILGEKRCRYVAGAGELWLLGRRIYVAGANDEKAQDKIRGLTLAGAYVDEISLMPESMWAMLMTRMSIVGAKVYGTTNPDNPNHWLMRDWLKRAKLWLRKDGTVHVPRARADVELLELHRFSFRLADNKTLSAKFIESLNRQFVGLWRRRFVEGDWVLAEGAIYDTFNTEPGAGHVVTKLPKMSDWVLAVDVGTVNPTVALLIGLGVDDRMYVAREWRHDSRKARRQMTMAEQSKALRGWLDGLQDELGPIELSKVIVDPSAAAFILQLHRDGWQHIRGADNTVTEGIRNVASLRAAGKLRIHESCDGHIEETSGYVWDPDAAKRGVEQPLKVADHGPDAERYGVMETQSWWRFWQMGDLVDAA